MKKLKTNNKGITLIALVVTIVVLLILAGISISMLTGENGIIKQAKEAKEQTEIAKEKEIIYLAFTSVQTAKVARGDMSDVTSAELQEEINNYTNDATVTGTGILKITYTSGREYEVDGNGNILSKESYDGMYSVGNLEGKIAPEDLFEYEIIDISAKKAKIVRIKAEYCNKAGYNHRTEAYDVTNTNCDIIYNGEKISDMLVIPYEATINGEKYTITETNLGVLNEGGNTGWSIQHDIYLPNVKHIIYPNTIESIEEYEHVDFFSEFYMYPLYGNVHYDYFVRCGSSILEKVTLSNKLKHMGEYAFDNCDNLQEIKNLDTLTSIAGNLFYESKWYEEWYDNLPDGDIYIGKVYYGYKGEMPENTTITIKDGTISIAGAALNGCTNLTGVTIPDSVTSIEGYAFYGCTNLTNIIMSDNITSIGERTFQETGWLNNQPDGPIYMGNIYLGYKGERPSTIEIKEGTTVIGGCAFYNDTELTDITIPSSVRRIGAGAFAACTSLTNVIFENGLISIGDCAFNECYNLRSITIPNSVQDIGNSAFSGCYNLTNIVISDNVKKIGHYSFAGCPIVDIVIPEGVVSIGRYAFDMCNNLNFVQIPNTVMTIDSRAFGNCPNLTTVNYTGTEEEWEKINIHIVENDDLKNSTIIYNTTIGTYSEFVDDFLKNKSEEELEELTLKSAGYLGTFEQYLSEGEITKADLEQIASQQNMTYVEYLKYNLKEYGQNWLYVEYLAYAQGEPNKTLEELRDLAVNGWGYESFEQFLGTEGMTMDDWQNVVKDNGFRSERDYLKCIVYASML